MIDSKIKSSIGLPSDEALSGRFNELCGYYTASLQSLQDEIEKKFVGKKEQTDILGAVYSVLDMENRSRRVLDCGSFLEFKVTEEKAKLQHANFCRDRLCPMCNWRRSLKIFAQVSKVMDALQAEGYQFLFLTLTVRNCSADELPSTVQALYDGWRYLYNKNKEFKSVIAGTFRSLEVKRKLDVPMSDPWYGTYHPHLHCILAVRPDYFTGRNYISQKRWTKLWRDAVGLDYDPIVHIEKCYLKDENGKKQTEGIDIGKAVAEATKYAVKGSDYLNGEDIGLSAETVQHLLDALTGRRLCGWIGCFQKIRKALDLDDCENGDLVHIDDDSIREDVACMVVRYSWRAGAYVRF